MYEYISGTVMKVSPKYVVIDNRGIGYQIFFPNPYICKKGDVVLVFTYFHVREDAQQIYGFLTEEERDLFVKLISVTGIGPKTALPILASSTVSEIISAIEAGDTKYIQKFPGIGQKAAAQIILDLRGKLEFDAMPETLLDEPKLTDAQDALIALGYNKKDVKKALDKVDTSLDTASIIKQALKILAKL